MSQNLTESQKVSLHSHKVKCVGGGDGRGGGLVVEMLVKVVFDVLEVGEVNGGEGVGEVGESGRSSVL